MFSIPWRFIQNSVQKSKVYLVLENSEVKIACRGIESHYIYEFHRRIEPSALKPFENSLKDSILITEYVPLSVEKRILATSKGYFDFSGNFAFRSNGKLIRNRVPRTKSKGRRAHKTYFESQNKNAAIAFRILLKQAEPVKIADLQKEANLSVGFLSQCFTFIKETIGSQRIHLPFTEDEKADFLQAWRRSYSRFEEKNYLLTGDLKKFLVSISKEPYPLLIQDKRLISGHGISTFLSVCDLPSSYLQNLGLVEDPNGNIRIKKASPYVLSNLEEACLDDIELYLVSLPDDKNSFQ